MNYKKYKKGYKFKWQGSEIKEVQKFKKEYKLRWQGSEIQEIQKYKKYRNTRNVTY